MSVVFHPPPRRLLVRGVNWLGDAVMTTPALLRLREQFPAAHITLLTPAKLEELWIGHPAVDDTIAFAAGEGLWAITQKLRAGRFDLALVLPNSPRSALETWLARIPQRIGYARPWRNALLTRPIPSRPDAVKMHKRSPEEIRALTAVSGSAGGRRAPAIPASAHQLYEYLHLAAALGASAEPLAPRLAVSPVELAAARQKFGLATAPLPLVGLNPGAEYGPAKRWPAERFSAAALAVSAHTPCTWVVFGGNNDRATAEAIESALRAANLTVVNLAGRTSLRELMAALKLCRVLLTNDTGPMHVAAALGTPVVAPFGSTSPELTGPGLPGDPRHRLLQAAAACSPCFLRECPIDFRCLLGIGAERVAAMVIARLKAES